MADEIDFANDLIDNEVSRALHKIREASAARSAVKTEFCLECGETIPSARQDMGFNLCVACAEEVERRGALFA